MGAEILEVPQFFLGGRGVAAAFAFLSRDQQRLGDEQLPLHVNHLRSYEPTPIYRKNTCIAQSILGKTADFAAQCFKNHFPYSRDFAFN